MPFWKTILVWSLGGDNREIPFHWTTLHQEILENEFTIIYVSGSIKALWVKKLRMCKEVASTKHRSSQMAMKMTNAFNSYQL